MDKEFSNIRIVDIAKMAGVSVGTVDRVIHNRGRVSEENRKKVQTILEMVHYQPNLMARSLASKKQFCGNYSFFYARRILGSYFRWYR